MKRIFRTSLCVALAGVCLAGTSRATIITINATDRGQYDDSGSHTPSNLNYVVGDDEDESYILHRNFFVFDLSGVTQPIVSAQLSLYNPYIDEFNTGYDSTDATETYAVYDVSTGIASLTDGTAGVGAYTDLGSGTSYGSYVASAADNGTFVTFSLNAAGLSALNSATGLFAIGGALTTLDAFNNIEYLFGFSGNNLADTQLILETASASGVPEPSVIALLGFGGLLLWKRRQS
jgi:hypothetical protein